MTTLTTVSYQQLDCLVTAISLVPSSEDSGRPMHLGTVTLKLDPYVEYDAAAVMRKVATALEVRADEMDRSERYRQPF